MQTIVKNSSELEVDKQDVENMNKRGNKVKNLKDNDLWKISKDETLMLSFIEEGKEQSYKNMRNNGKSFEMWQKT